MQGIERQSLFEVTGCALEILARTFPEVVPALQVSLRDGGVYRASCTRALRIVRRGDLNVNLGGDGASHFVRQREHAANLPFVALGPEMRVGGGLDDLHRDPDAVPLPLHRALDDDFDPELRGDLRERLACVFIAL